MQNKVNEIVDLKEIYLKIRSNWFLFLITLFISLIVAFAYNRYAKNLYHVETSILIKNEDDISSASDLIYDKVSSTKKILENKEHMLTSFPLVYKTLED